MLPCVKYCGHFPKFESNGLGGARSRCGALLAFGPVNKMSWASSSFLLGNRAKQQAIMPGKSKLICLSCRLCDSDTVSLEGSARW